VIRHVKVAAETYRKEEHKQKERATKNMLMMMLCALSLSSSSSSFSFYYFKRIVTQLQKRSAYRQTGNWCSALSLLRRPIVAVLLQLFTHRTNTIGLTINHFTIIIHSLHWHGTFII